MRWLKTVTSSAKIALAAGLLAGILSPALAGGSGAAAQLPATAKPAAAADREASLKRIERLKRSGKLADARRLMPMLKNPDELVSREAEQAIWLLWGRSGNPGVDRLFRAGVSQIGNDEVERAIETFSRVIDNQPTFAEAWNKRATARFLAGDLIGAMDDCERTLSLVPDHFGSLAGYGHIYFRLERPRHGDPLLAARAGGQSEPAQRRAQHRGSGETPREARPLADLTGAALQHGAAGPRAGTGMGNGDAPMHCRTPCGVSVEVGAFAQARKLLISRHVRDACPTRIVSGRRCRRKGSRRAGRPGR